MRENTHLFRPAVLFLFLGGARKFLREMSSSFLFSNQSGEEYVAVIGTRNVWGGTRPVGLSLADRRQHLFIIGQSGTGKSTLLRNLFLQDMYAGVGVALIDPHGDLAEDLIDCVPTWRTDDVVYLNPSDPEWCVGMNLLQHVPPERRHLVASGVVAAFKGIWKDSWGPRLEYILWGCVAALLECQNVSLLGVQRMLSDERYRRWVLKQVKDPMVKQFWLKEFAHYDKRFLQEAISPIQNKIGQVLSAAPLRNILGQVTSTFDLQFMMDKGRIFIANLSKGLLGEDKANLLGSLLVTQFQLAAMSRASMPEVERRDFVLYVDEFHNFVTDSFASMLAETRKYRLSMALVAQHTAQTTPIVRDAIFGNCGSVVSFRVGEADASILGSHLGGYKSDELTGLDNREAVMRMLSNGKSVGPFGVRTLDSIQVNRGRRDAVLFQSRQRYARSRREVENRIKRVIR